MGTYDKFKLSSEERERQAKEDREVVEKRKMQEKEDRYEKALLFCEAYGVKKEEKIKARWEYEIPTEEQVEAVRRFGLEISKTLTNDGYTFAGGTHAKGENRLVYAFALNQAIDEARALRRKRSPRVWEQDEEIIAKAMKNTNQAHGKAVTERSTLRAECLALLGGRCAMCGCTDARVLQFDHIHDDGADARRAGFVGDVLYRDILARGAAEYQILCANDNWRKRLAALDREKS